MKYSKFSPRQCLAMLWWNDPRFRFYDGILCDGSIRSGKTMSMTIGFIIWSMACFSDCFFAISGKTVESTRRNIVMHLRDWLPPEYLVIEKRSEHLVLITSRVTRKTNTYYIFGGRDESSYTLVQGLTLAGVLLDEVALMPRSYVEQIIARMSVEGSKLWLNCNPGSPEHYIYKEWVLKRKEKRMLYLHFTMRDNFSLSDKIRERYERSYTGVFYRRYIEGEWCIADGLVYDFRKDIDCIDLTNWTPPDKRRPPEACEWWVSIDYGTHNPFSAGLWCLSMGTAIRVAEWYHSGRDTGRTFTPEEYYVKVRELIGKRPVLGIVVDPAASEFIETIVRHGEFPVYKANNAVLDGIRYTQTLLKAGLLKIGTNCTDAIREFGLYSWDSKSSQDRVIKESDHSMDDIRYFAYTIMRGNPSVRYALHDAGIMADDDKAVA